MYIDSQVTIKLYKNDKENIRAIIIYCTVILMSDFEYLDLTKKKTTAGLPSNMSYHIYYAE